MQFPDVYTIIEDGYSVIDDDGTEMEFAEGGMWRKQILFDEMQHDITFQVAALSPVQALNLRQFYNSYKYETIQWTDPFTDVVYDVTFAGPPRPVGTAGKTARIEVRMRGTKNVG